MSTEQERQDAKKIQKIYKELARGPKLGVKFYCVGCNRERRQSPPALAGSRKFYSHILITTAFISLFFWPIMHWKGLFAFVIPVGLFFEALYRIRMRSALMCPDCGFDPILFLSDRPKALSQVEAAWRKKFLEKNLEYPERTAPLRAPKKKTPPSEDRLTSS